MMEWKDEEEFVINVDDFISGAQLLQEREIVRHVDHRETDERIEKTDHKKRGQKT